MGLFTGNSSLDRAIDEATSGNKTSEDWGEILEIVDQIELQPNGAKDALKAIMKRVKHKDSHVAILGLILLDACVANAKRKFHLEVSSRFFDEEVRGILQNSGNYNHEIIVRLCQLIKKWSENEFKSDPALSIIPTLFHHIKSFKPQFLNEPILPKMVTTGSQPASADAAAARKREEDELAKAIALSIEEDKRKKRSSSVNVSSTLYPAMESSSVSSSSAIYATVNKQKEPRKVRAMYDFEAAEDNELTFKAGEVIHVTDDSDPNWWKGSSHRGEGLFPTNFVTSDLNWEPENDYPGTKQKAKEETASVTSEIVEQKPVTIDESLIDKTLNMIHDADPTGERPDPEDLIALEEQCGRMWPLIDNELQNVDRLQSDLEELSVQMNDALAMYDTLMKEQAAQLSAGNFAPPGEPVNIPAAYYQQQQIGQPTGYPSGYGIPAYQGFQDQQASVYQGPPSSPYAPQVNPAKLAAAVGGAAPVQGAYPQQQLPPSVFGMPPQGQGYGYPNQQPPQ